MKEVKDKFSPNYALHPGIVLQDDLMFAKISQTKLSELTGIQKTVINEIIRGKRNLSAKIAVLLERAFPYEASYWTRLQSFYDETKARLELKELESENRIEIDYSSLGIRCDHVDAQFANNYMVYTSPTYKAA